MSRFDEQKRQRFIENVDSRMSQASIAFAGKARDLVDSQKTALAHALDIIAGGMVDGEGDPLTRQDLLDELAAIPAVE